MTQDMSSGSPESKEISMVIKQKQFCPSINVLRKILNNSILFIQRMRVILIISRILFNALSGLMI